MALASPCNALALTYVRRLSENFMIKKTHERADKQAKPKAGDGDTPAPEADIVAEELARLEAEDAAHASQGAATAPAEPADSAIQRLEREVAEWKDRALRASADFDNYRKRAIKERDEAWGRGAAESFAKLTDAIDDLARVAHLDPEKTTALSLHEGMLNIERKLMRILEGAGLERIDPTGQKFDPRVAEAISMMPAPNPEADQTVGAVYQAGYQYKGQVLRPARVVVQQWQGEPAGDGGSDA